MTDCKCRGALIACLLGLTDAGYAEEGLLATDQWQVATSVEGWSYATGYQLRGPVPVPERQYTVEGRLNIALKRDELRVEVAPRVSWTRNCLGVAAGCQDESQGKLNQLYLSYASGGNQIVVGREKLNWGPATFRSPSNPFYFDSGKTNPLADLPGIDLARWTHSQGRWRLTSAYIFDTRVQPQQVGQHQAVLFKLDRQSDSALLSLIFSQPRDQKQGAFWGGFAQYTPDDAWLLYAEASQREGNVESIDRGSRWLAGASYTRENGQMLSAEYLFNGNGRPAGGSHDLATSLVPRLKNRHYLWASIQSNPQELNRYWRLEWVRNLDDRSQAWLAYGEARLQERLSGFVLLSLGSGRSGSEYGGVYRVGLTLGIKVYLL